MKKIFFLLAVCLTACAVSKQITGPDGENLYHVNCSGTMLSWVECYEKAGELCPNGYEVQNVIGQNTGSTASFNQFGFYSSPVITREIFITCK